MRSSCCPRPSIRPPRAGSSGGTRMCCAIRSASPSSRGRSPRRRPTGWAMKRPCAGRRATTPFLSPPTQTAITSIITSITAPSPWTAPGNIGTSSAPGGRSGGSLTGCASSMSCPSSRTPSCPARALSAITGSGWGMASAPRRKNSSGPSSTRYWPSPPPISRPFSPRWRRQASRCSTGGAVRSRSGSPALSGLPAGGAPPWGTATAPRLSRPSWRAGPRPAPGAAATPGPRRGGSTSSLTSGGAWLRARGPAMRGGPRSIT